MRNTVIATSIMFAASLCLVSVTTAFAASADARKDYVLHCVACHGVDGKGNGIAAQVIPGFKRVDLTQLSKTHGGKFPRQEVYDIVDGRKRLPGHYDEDTDMPLSGLMFQTKGREFSTESEAKVKQRVSALVDYVEGIQEK